MIRDFMMWDHERLNGIFEKFRSLLSSSPEEAFADFVEFKDGLLQHLSWEEELLFPLYQGGIQLHPGADELEMVTEMRDEHREVRRLLREMVFDLRHHDVRVREASRLLQSLLRNLEEKEEHVLYNWIDNHASPAEREAVMNRITHRLVAP